MRAKPSEPDGSRPASEGFIKFRPEQGPLAYASEAKRAEARARRLRAQYKRAYINKTKSRWRSIVIRIFWALC